MRFGGILFKKWTSPEEWAQLAIASGYSAVYFPVDHTAPVQIIDGYARAAKAADLTICEIGVWNNPLDPDPATRQAAIQRAIRQLELAEYVQANCCVNIAGSYSPTRWDGPYAGNLTKRAFDDIVKTTQTIIDAVLPTHTCYSLEPMPFLYPDTADSYLELLQTVDRPGFGAHLDIVNVINSPRKYYDNTNVINEWFDKLGGHIKSCHAKDIILRDDLTVHLDECRPGTGALDYATYLRRVSELDDNICVMLEHMTEPADYELATKHLKTLANSLGLTL